MTRWILCPSCGAKHREKYPQLYEIHGDQIRYAGLLFPASDRGPAETGTMARGLAKFEMVCDHCSAGIAEGAAAWAVGITVAGTPRSTPPGWETEYLSLEHDRSCNVYLDDEGDIEHLTDAQLCTCGFDDSGWTAEAPERGPA